MMAKTTTKLSFGLSSFMTSITTLLADLSVRSLTKCNITYGSTPK